MQQLVEKIMENLKFVLDPELNINVVDLGLIYGVEMLGERVAKITMTLTTPGCPLHDSIVSGVKYCIEGMEEIDTAEVELTWAPAWSPDKMTDAGKRLLQGF